MQSNNDTSQINAHEHLLEMLSAILLQLNALQTVVRNDKADLNAMRKGLTTMEQITREAIYELRSVNDDMPLPDLVGVTLVEALSRAIEETAESLRLSSRVVFSGEERPLPSYIERLLYRIAQETLYQVQQHIDARKLRFTFSYGHDEVQMSIEDDGTLPGGEEEIPVPHFRDAVGNGNGVVRNELGTAYGPYIDLRHRIEHLGGSLEVSAQPEQGTRVQARVPYTIMPKARTENNVPGSQGDRKGSARAPQTRSLYNSTDTKPKLATEHIHVLVVDSQAVSRAGLRRLLESYPDLEVVGEAADGVQAVSETLELGPQVVLMDANLPNRQSMEALKQIKQLNLDTRVLLLSAQDREEYLYETLRAGADGYVLKDIAPDELAQAIRAVARGEVLVQPQLASRLLSRFGRQGRGNYPYETLTAREQEVLQLLARGLRNKEIAARLHVSERTVNFHLANIYQKLNVSGRTEALSKALEQGLITA
jgi:DNA-binding NarL/FixJ family response regulator